MCLTGVNADVVPDAAHAQLMVSSTKVGGMGMRQKAFVALLFLTGCGYQLGPKEITLANAKGETSTTFSCGSYMRVSSEGWGTPTFDVTFTDANGQSHDLYGVSGVGVADLPSTVDAPMWAFSSGYVPGEKYANADGTPGNEIKEGDIAVKGDNKARLTNGKWTPVKVPNPACEKH